MIFDTDDLILKTKDYDFTPFSHQGFGGTRKYIATPKKKNLPKLLIKHEGEYAPSCNNFIYSRVGQLAGVRTPKVYLMDVAKRDRHLFASPSVVGIEYIEGLEPVNMQVIKGNATLEKEFVDCFTLFALFTDFEDNMQYAYVPHKAIYPLDFDESFGLTNGLFYLIISEDDGAEYYVSHHLKAGIRKSTESHENIGIEVAAEALGVSPEYAMKYCLETLERFCKLTEEEIASVTDALIEFFPPLLAVYYEDYIQILQAQAKAYIIKHSTSE